MALIKCPECNKEISDKSKICIHCGYPLEEELQTTKSNIFKEGNPFIDEEEKPEPDITEPNENVEIPEPKMPIETEEIKNSKEDDKALKNIIIIFTMLIVLVFGIMMITRKNNKKEVQTNERNEYVNQIMITTEYINIRKGRSTSTEKIGKVYQGEIYTILSEGDAEYIHWYEIKTTNGIKGYIADKEGYTKKLNTTTHDYSEQTTTTTITTTTPKPTTKSTTKKTNKPQNTTTTTKKANTTTVPAPSTTTTQQTTTTTRTTTLSPTGYTIYSIEGIGGISTKYGTTCTLDTFNAKLYRSGNSLKLEYDFRMTLQVLGGTYGYCDYTMKVYDSRDIVITTTSLFVGPLEEKERGSKSGNVYLNSDDRAFRIKIVPAT